MSGAEVAAGLVLGTLPLLISAAEHYKKTYRPFRRWRNFSQELKRFEEDFSDEELFFRNECVILLGSLVGSETAGQMLRNQANDLWADKTLDEKFSKFLGASRDRWCGLLQQVGSRLVAMETRCEAFSIGNDIKATEISDKSPRSTFRRRFDFSLSGPGLEEELEALRVYNKTFERLSCQICRLASLPIVEVPESQTPSYDLELSRCQLTQKATIRLHKALVKGCRADHSACFRLLEKKSDNESSVRFDIVKKHICDEEGANEDPLWFAIESISIECDERVAPSKRDQVVAGALSEFTGTHKRLNRSPSLEEHQLKKPNGMSGQVSHKISGAGIDKRLKKSLSNLSQHGEFCKQVRRCCMQQHFPGGYLGYLDKNGAYEHRVLFLPRAGESRKWIPLSQIISKWQGQTYGESLLIFEGLQLARQLASAVLQYHETPLLRENWNSSDVVFLNLDNPTALTAPHLNVEIRQIDPSVISKKEITRKSIRNQHTFALGLIMIELAYQAPLVSLKKLSDRNGQDTQETNFLLAKRISSEMITQLGLPYKRMVQKCINCDFGEGTDLTKPRLQAAFYKDVVCGLESLENRFKELHIDE